MGQKHEGNGWKLFKQNKMFSCHSSVGVSELRVCDESKK